MYVDESGDVGTINSPTRYFVLSAIVVHELRWREVLQNLVVFRRYLRDHKDLKLREEIHAVDFINKPGKLIRIKRNDRLDILKKCLDWIDSQQYINVFSIVVDKNGRTDDIFELAWNTLAMRFENTIANNNFRGPRNPDEKGIILSDNTEGQKLRRLIRKMRHFNIIPNNRQFFANGGRNIRIEGIIEDPVFRDSKFSFLHQMVDVVAYFVRQKYQPNSYIKKKGGHNYYNRLSNVAVTHVSRRNNFGIVEI